MKEEVRSERSARTRTEPGNAEGPMSRSIRLVVVDDHELIRRGVQQLAAAQADVELVGESERVSGALELIEETRPDVAVLDVRLPDGGGVELCREARSRFPEVRCLMFTSYADEEALFNAVMAGASGFILKSAQGEELLAGVRAAAAGQSLLDPALTRSLMEGMRADPTSRDPARRLTEQERRVLDLVGEGLTNRQIGERLYLAEKTVKNYVSNLLSKLGMEHRTQAALYAARRRDQG